MVVLLDVVGITPYAAQHSDESTVRYIVLKKTKMMRPPNDEIEICAKLHMKELSNDSNEAE